MFRDTRIRPFFALIVAALTSLSCVGPLARPMLPRVSDINLEGWLELRSPDFILYSRGSKENLEALAIDLARYAAVVEQLVQSQPPKSPAEITMTEGRVEELFFPDPWVGGYMAPWLGGFSGFMRGSSNDPGHRHLLLHEFSHYLTLRNRKAKYPSWYKEGFAEFLGSTRVRGDTMEIGSAPPNSLVNIEDRRRRKTWKMRKKNIDLEEIFSFQKVGHWRYPDNFYAISWATVHYLNSDPDRQNRLISMLEFQNAGQSWNRAYSRAFAEPIEVLAAQVLEHAKSLRMGSPSAILYLPLESLNIRRDWQIRSIPQIEVLQLLGRLALRDVLWLETPKAMRMAEALFKRALLLDPDSSLSSAGLAASFAAQGQFSQSAIHLEKFKIDTEPSPDALVYAGNAVQYQALAQTNNESDSERFRLHNTAISLFQRAIEVDPSNAFAQLGRGISQLETNQFDAARASLFRAETIGEWDAELTLNQGRLEQNAGSKRLAREFWNDVVQLGHESEIKRANKLLEELEEEN